MSKKYYLFGITGLTLAIFALTFIGINTTISLI